MISSRKSSWKPITSVVPQGSIQSAMLFKIFIKNLGDRAECTLIKFTDGTKLEGAADRPAGCVTIQTHLDKLEKQDDRNLMQFCKGKYQVLTLLEQRVRQDELQHSLPTATNPI